MCCGHLGGDGPNPGSLLNRIENDVCVCCGEVRGDYRRTVKNYIAERVWVCAYSDPYSRPDAQASCCRSSTIDHAVLFRDIILQRLSDELRERM